MSLLWSPPESQTQTDSYTLHTHTRAVLAVEKKTKREKRLQNSPQTQTLWSGVQQHRFCVSVRQLPPPHLAFSDANALPQPARQTWRAQQVRHSVGMTSCTSEVLWISTNSFIFTHQVYSITSMQILLLAILANMLATKVTVRARVVKL